MADLEANFAHLAVMHESLSRFSENFAAFLYGMNMNAFCVDFPEAPIKESWARSESLEGKLAALNLSGDADATFLWVPLAAHARGY